jgi:3-methyladenine DNA glycosylase AlkD
MSTVNDFISRFVLCFENLNDSHRAVEMSQYMKNRFSFLGISSPKRRDAQKDILIELKNERIEFKWSVAEELWAKEEREFHYAAIDIITAFKPKQFQADDIHKLKWFITQNAWWDSVDLLASTALGNYFQQFPTMINEVISEWRENPSIWLKRSCLIFQLKYKEKTDTNLLQSLIHEFKIIDEFFIQKAIGWSLRQFGKYNENWVKTIVENENLNGIAKKEALRKF